MKEIPQASLSGAKPISMSGTKKSGKKPLPNGWIVLPSKTYPDRVYFYNTITKCSTWENPCESSRSRKPEKSSSDSSSSRERNSKKHKKKSSSKLKKKLSDAKGSEHWKSDLKKLEEIEDYDEQQDQYFHNVFTSSISLSHSSTGSPPGSPASIFSSNTSLKDSDNLKSTVQSETNIREQIWSQPISNQHKTSGKKDTSEIERPSTSGSTSKKENDLGSERRKYSRSVSLSNTTIGAGRNALKKIKCNKDALRDEINKKKIKDLPSDSNTHKKDRTNKTLKNVAFKKRDKTPAQTRLLKLRQQNAADLLKQAKLASDTPVKSSSCDMKAKDSLQSAVSDVYIENDSDNDVKKADINQDELPQSADCSAIEDFSEEMDWETTNEELVVENVNNFRQQQYKTKEIPSDIFFGLTSESSCTLPSKSNSWFLVLDTNILISCLSFVKELRDSNISGLGYPILYIPWRVLQELDHLKDSKIDEVDKQLHSNIRKAINYLNDNFKSRHPRCFGQSFDDFAKMVYNKAWAPDDEILQTCIELKKLHPDKKLTLLTNDKNLESKAIISNIETYSKERFQKKYLSCNGIPNNLNEAIEAVAVVKVDDFVCQLKSILKECIPLIVETEMKIAFQDDWVKLAYKKPPWTLEDALNCFKKYWRSVFFLVFSKDALAEIENLLEKLFKKEPSTVENVTEVINISQKLMASINKSQPQNRSYLEVVEATSAKLCNLLEQLSSKITPQIASDAVIENPLQFSSQSSFSLPTELFFNNTEAQQIQHLDDFWQVKNLFKDIWDSLNSFCGSISMVINSACSNNATVSGARLTLSHIVTQVRELILYVEKIFEIRIQDLNENHPAILHLTNFLIKSFPAMAMEIRNRLPKCLVTFCSHLEGRSLLNKCLNDFKELSRDLAKAADYFDRNFGGI